MATNAQVAHRWANRTVKETGLRSLHMSATPDSIYSYGSHFKIAQWVDIPKRRNTPAQSVILFTTRTYSVTTSGHCGRVRNAIPPGVPVFHVPNLDPGSSFQKENLADYETRAAKSLLKAKRARMSTEWHLKEAQETIAEAAHYALAFGIRWKPPVLDTLVTRLEIRAKQQAALYKRQVEEREQRRIAEEAQARLEQAEAFADWQRGAEIRCPRAYYKAPDGSSYLRRVTVAGADTVQTSQGADAPWEHVARAREFVRRVKEAGTPWHSNGKTIPVGHYRIESIDADGTVRAGCHVFTWPIVSAFFQSQL